jgi:hypothetical protein
MLPLVKILCCKNTVDALLLVTPVAYPIEGRA